MNRNLPVLLFSFLLLFTITYGQPPVKQPDGGGSYSDMVKIKDEIGPLQRNSIITMLKDNESRLRREGKLLFSLNPNATLFAWPLRQAPGFNDNGYYGISNYVDENPLAPDALLDYNCGNRTYDLVSGYNHQGTDIFSWPFPWQKMARNAIEVIAGAPGIILGKSDGNFDQNCAFCTTCTWNAVYVIHDDGSVAWYGHLKSGSVITKNPGDPVETGELLGIMGSSGSSTGPHLHFELYINSSFTQLVDPWAGPCNTLNGNTGWWANQEPYYVPTLNKIMTHGAPPASNSCPGGEVPNEKINFTDGQTVYLGSYYRDQQNGDQAIHTVYRPNNTILSSWTQNFTNYFSASWWYYPITLPNPAATGVWRYEIQYKGKRLNTFFSVNSSSVNICPGSINPIFSNLTGSTYQWQENTGTGFTDINDNGFYTGTLTNQLQLNNVPSSFYGYQYRCVVNGTSFSHIISLRFVNHWNGLKSGSWNDPFNWSCGYVPDANTDVMIQNGVSNYPEVDSDTFCRTMSISGGATLTIKPGVNLTLTR